MIVGSNITHLKEATIQRKTRHNNETSGENRDYGESGTEEEYESDEYDVEGAGMVNRRVQCVYDGLNRCQKQCKPSISAILYINCLKQDVIIVNTIDEIVTRLDSVDIGNAFHDDLGFQDNPNYAQYNGGDESSVRNY